jgi:hypothetical protein
MTRSVFEAPVTSRKVVLPTKEVYNGEFFLE